MLHRSQRGLKKAALSLGLAMLALLAGTSPSSGAEQGIEEQNCQAFQLFIRVPIRRVEDLVPEPFTIKEEPDSPDETIFSLTMERCEEMKIDGAPAGSVVFFHADIGIEFPAFLYEEEERSAEEDDPSSFSLWGATNNPDHFRYLQQQGAAGPGFVEHLRYETVEDGPFQSFLFEAPEPTPSPFTVTARFAPTTPEGTGIPWVSNGYSLAPRGVLIVDDNIVQDLRFHPVTEWQITTPKGSLLDRILCDGPRSSTDPRAAARPLDPATVSFASASQSVRLEDPIQEIGTPGDVECPTAGQPS